MDRVVICTRWGEPITQVKANVPRSWILNGVGEATLTMSRFDSKCTSDIFKIGNLLWVQSDCGLPDWGGRLNTDLSYDSTSATAKAYTIESLLAYRYGRYAMDMLPAGVAGLKIKNLVRIANEQEDTNIEIGKLWMGGRPLPKWPITTDSIYEEMVRFSQKISHGDVVIEPRLMHQKSGDPFSLYFLLNFYERAGDPTNLWLIDGYNISMGSNLYTETGEIINWLIGYNASASTEEKRAKWFAENKASQREYGLLQRIEEYQYGEEEAIRYQVEYDLDEWKQPAQVFDVKAVNKDNLFKKLRLGNEFMVFSHSGGHRDRNLKMGVSGRGRIYGMQYLPDERTTRLIVKRQEYAL